MKKLFIMLALVASTASFAAPLTPVSPQESVPQATLMVTPSGKLSLVMGREASTARIVLRDDWSRTIYSGTASLAEGLKQDFDVSALAAGEYTMVILVGKQKLVKTFTVGTTSTLKSVQVAS